MMKIKTPYRENFINAPSGEFDILIIAKYQIIHSFFDVILYVFKNHNPGYNHGCFIKQLTWGDRHSAKIILQVRNNSY
jgi:hypothetical protein